MVLRRLPPQLARTLVYMATILVTQAASFLLLPVVTRFLGPEQYGAYAVALAVSNLLAMIGTSWIRNVAFRFYYDAVADGTTRSFFWTLVLLQATVIATLFAVAVVATALSPEPWVPPTTLLAAAAMMLSGDVLALSVALLRAEQRAGRFFLAEATSATTRVIGTLLGLLAGARSPEFLFLAAAVAAAAGAVIAVTSLRPHLHGPSGLDGKVAAQVAGRAVGAMPFSIGEWLNTLADRLILDLFTTRAIVGVYAAGHSVGDRLVGGLVMAVFMMAWPDVLQSWNDGGTAPARIALRRYAAMFMWFTAGPVVALMLYAGTVVRLLGGEYQAAVEVIPLIALAAWIRGFGNCFNRHHELQKRFWAMSAMTLAGAAVNVTLNFLLVPRYEAVGAALATLVAQTLVMLGFVVTRDRDLVRFPFAEAGMVALAVVVSGVCAWWLVGTGIAGLLTFALVYVLIMAGVFATRLRRGGTWGA